MRHQLLTILLALLTQAAYSQKNDLLSVIVSNDEIDLTDTQLVTIPMQGPFMLAGNEVHSLMEDNSTTTVTFPEEMYIEDMIWTGENFVVKSRHEIYMLNDVETPVFVFEEEEFKVFPCNEQKIFIVYHGEGKDIVYYGNLKLKRAKRLIAFNEEVVYVTALGEATMIVTTENIYLFTDKECIRYMDFWKPVHTAIMTSKGLFFATDEEICLLTGVDSFILLFDIGCQQLLYDSKDLYILTNDFNLMKCDMEMLQK